MNPIRKIKLISNYKRQRTAFLKLVNKEKYYPFIMGRKYPCLNEAGDSGGTAKGHYFHQDLLVAQLIFESNPEKHVDFGSMVNGFVAHVASYREIEVFDIRPTESNARNIIFKQADLMNVDDTMIDYCDSISSLHAIEHMGLGRYGDPLNPNGHIDALNTIYRILKTGGTFYFSVPIGTVQRIEYNAHRVFSIPYLINLFSERYETCSLSYVDDHGDLYANVSPDKKDVEHSFGCSFGCGIFELKKK